jgi:two-component system, cell cycle sensor histidine kinase and response regulator CckA
MPGPTSRDQSKSLLPVCRYSVDSEGGSETILVVDDNSAFRRFVRMLLEKGGYSVLEAQTCAQAVQVVTECRAPIHLLLTDVMMPQIDGYQLSDYLRFHRPDMCVLYMSGYSSFPACRPDRSKLNVQILAKPFRKESLLMAVKQALSNGHGVTELERFAART